MKRHRSLELVVCLFSTLMPGANGQTASSMPGKRRMPGVLISPSNPSNHNPSPFEASWPWSPARSTARPQRSATCGYSNQPSLPAVLGSRRQQHAPGAHWRQKPSIEPRFFASRARLVQPAMGPLDFQHCLCPAPDLRSLAMPTCAEYLEKWLKQSTAQGLTNPLVNLPVKRFWHVQRAGFHSRATGSTVIVGVGHPI